MSTHYSGAGNELDKLIHNCEFENLQHVKLIEHEEHLMQALDKELEEKQKKIEEIQSAIPQLDNDTKHCHKQYTINRGNIESQKKTQHVLAEHIAAMSIKLEMRRMTQQQEKERYDGHIKHYAGVWEGYRHKYESTPLFQRWQKQKRLEEEISYANQQKKDSLLRIQQQSREIEGKTNFSMMDTSIFIIKLAEKRVITMSIMKEIQNQHVQLESLRKTTPNQMTCMNVQDSLNDANVEKMTAMQIGDTVQEQMESEAQHIEVSKDVSSPMISVFSERDDVEEAMQTDPVPLVSSTHSDNDYNDIVDSNPPAQTWLSSYQQQHQQTDKLPPPRFAEAATENGQLIGEPDQPQTELESPFVQYKKMVTTEGQHQESVEIHLQPDSVTHQTDRYCQHLSRSSVSEHNSADTNLQAHTLPSPGLKNCQTICDNAASQNLPLVSITTQKQVSERQKSQLQTTEQQLAPPKIFHQNFRSDAGKTSMNQQVQRETPKANKQENINNNQQCSIKVTMESKSSNNTSYPLQLQAPRVPRPKVLSSASGVPAQKNTTNSKLSPTLLPTFQVPNIPSTPVSLTLMSSNKQTNRHYLLSHQNQQNGQENPQAHTNKQVQHLQIERQQIKQLQVPKLQTQSQTPQIQQDVQQHYTKQAKQQWVQQQQVKQNQVQLQASKQQMDQRAQQFHAQQQAQQNVQQLQNRNLGQKRPFLSQHQKQQDQTSPQKHRDLSKSTAEMNTSSSVTPTMRCSTTTASSFRLPFTPHVRQMVPQPSPRPLGHKPTNTHHSNHMVPGLYSFSQSPGQVNPDKKKTAPVPVLNIPQYKSVQTPNVHVQNNPQNSSMQTSPVPSQHSPQGTNIQKPPVPVHNSPIHTAVDTPPITEQSSLQENKMEQLALREIESRNISPQVDDAVCASKSPKLHLNTAQKPKTPEHIEMQHLDINEPGETGVLSPFSMEKHLAKLAEIKKSPGLLRFSSDRRMFNVKATTVDSGINQDKTDVSGIPMLGGQGDSIHADCGNGRDVSVGMFGGGDHVSDENRNKEGTFSFGGADTSDQSQKTGVFSLFEDNKHENGSPGFSFEFGDKKADDISNQTNGNVFSMFGGNNGNQQENCSDGSFSFSFGGKKSDDSNKANNESDNLLSLFGGTSNEEEEVSDNNAFSFNFGVKLNPKSPPCAFSFF